MYCKHCGDKTLKGALYCQNDGNPLFALNEGYQIKKDPINFFCSHCSCENGKENLYCISCGSSLEKIVEKSSRHTQNSAVVGHVQLKDKRFTTDTIQGLSRVGSLGSSLLYSIISLIISLLLSWATSAILNSEIKNNILSNIPAELTEKLKLISTTDVLMLSHMVGLRFNGMISSFEGSITTSGGLFVLMIIPAISLLVVGYLSGRNSPNKSAIERIYSAVPIAVIYAGLFAFISLFSGVSVDKVDPTGYLEMIYLKANYSFSDALMRSLIIGFIFTSLGSLLSLPKSLRGSGTNQAYGISIQRALIATFAGMVICMVVIIGLFFSNEEFNSDNMPMGAKVATATQVGGYFWNLSHLNSISLNGGPEDEMLTFSYSLLGGIESDLLGLPREMMDGKIIDNIWFLLLVPLLIHVWSGRQLRRAVSGNILIELVAYAVAFGIINVLLAYTLKFKFYTNIDGIFTLNLGFSLTQSFFSSTVIAFMCAYVGVLIFDRYSKMKANNM